jgi:hypothetical protein
VLKMSAIMRKQHSQICVGISHRIEADDRLEDIPGVNSVVGCSIDLVKDHIFRIARLGSVG